MTFKVRSHPAGRAAAEVITALHQAKQELAQEMEANLKQLKAVLKETDRIAKQMEAVLAEIKGEGQKNSAQGQQMNGQQGGKQNDQQGDQTSDQAGAKEKQQAQADQWHVPSFSEGAEAPPPWQPPVLDARDHKQAH